MRKDTWLNHVVLLMVQVARRGIGLLSHQPSSVMPPAPWSERGFHHQWWCEGLSWPDSGSTS